MTTSLQADPISRTLGRFSFRFDGGELSRVRLDDVEVVRRVFVTVRDEAWDTPPIELQSLSVIEDGERGCSLEVEAGVRSETIDVCWEARIDVGGDGSITYDARFTPQHPFSYARMGLCVLFPPAALIGQRYEAWQGAKGHTERRFERLIAPQRFEGDQIMPLFPAFDLLRIELSDFGSVQLALHGDLFEMEDQRNWCDGSFKAYCTPLSRPRPQRAVAGQSVRQRASLLVTPQHNKRRPTQRTSSRQRVSVGRPTGRRFPRLGVLIRDRISASAAEKLAASSLEHIRVELRCPTDLEEEIAWAATVAGSTGARLAPVLFLSSDTAESEHAAALLADLPVPPARITVFSSVSPCETGDLVQRFRHSLNGRLSSVPLFGGTDGPFADLNRDRPNATLLDGVSWSVSPQVHANDDLTIIEGLEALGPQVETARTFGPNLQLWAGPISMRPRYNPAATDAEEQKREPPKWSIDPRQDKLFTAAWTAASLGKLAEADVDIATYFEATGARGMLSDDGKRAYPVWKVIEAASVWSGLEVVAASSCDPLKLQAVGVRANGDRELSALLVANLTDCTQRVEVRPLPWSHAQLSVLSEAAESWNVETVEIAQQGLSIELARYAVARIIGLPPGHVAPTFDLRRRPR